MEKHNAYHFLEKLAFERVSGSEKELEAAHLIIEECASAGVSAKIESFAIPAPKVTDVKLEITSPITKEIYCTGLGKSGQTPEEGIEAPFVYIHGGEDEYIADVKGKIVLSTGGMKQELRQKLVEAGAVGYITTWGGYYDDEIMITQVPHRFVRLSKDDTSSFPGVMINLRTARELLQAHPETVRIVLRQNGDAEGESRNVVAEIRGTEKPEEVVLFSAHYDSVEFSNGAWDNGTGSVTIMEILRYYAANPPKRTVRFVWCGSEEIGLLGSWAYCTQHSDELKNIILNINFDMTGVIMANNCLFGSCDRSIIDHGIFMGKVKGIHFQSRMGLMPSDSTSFAINDVPAMSFGTMTPKGGAEIHSRRDVIDNVDPDELDTICAFACEFSSDIVNAVVNVVPRQLPKEALDEKEKMKKMLGLN
ncbi:MAG: M28 family peptidase [Bulleidia sp.]